MKRRLIVWALAVGLLSSAGLAFAAEPAPTTVHADYWSPGLFLDGDVLHQSFANEKGERVHLFSYNGTGYLPLRSAGELMGKQVEWDGEARAVRLSGVSDARTEMTHRDMELEAKLRQEGMEVQLRPDISVYMDGVEQTFTNVNGETVYPAAFNGSVYLPLRSVGELMGKQVTWKADPVSGAQMVYLSTPLPGGEADALGAFLDQALPLAGELEGLCSAVMEKVYRTDDPAAAETDLRELADTLDRLAAIPAPETDFGGEWYQLYSTFLAQYQAALQEGVEQLDQGADLYELMEERSNGLNSAVQQAWQMLFPILENLRAAYEVL